MAKTNRPTTEHPPTFLEQQEQKTAKVDTIKPRRPARESTKHKRYESTRVETGIVRRVRRDGTGKPAYEASVWVNGRALSKTFTVLRDARRWREENLGRRATGDAKIPQDRRITTGQFVKTVWFPWLDEQIRFDILQPSTVLWYKIGAKRLVSEIGHGRLSKVDKVMLRKMLSSCIEAGNSESVLHQLRASTRSVLALAVERDILTANPSGSMSGKNAPRALRRPTSDPKAWSEGEAQAFLRYVQGDRLEALWILFLGSGLRRGEALALRWEDIDLDERTVTVTRSLIQINGRATMSYPKTEDSKRTVVVGESVVGTLQTLRRIQAAERLAAPQWHDAEGLVFTTSEGVWLRPEFVTRRLKRIVAEAGLPWIRLHGLRHTMASLALQNGIDVATVSERLGHASVGITVEIYLHGSKESDRAAADVLDAALHG
ncbi:MAG: site-specific integrase [Actinomycetia bacterium]|nr:site-specific integrase [Actinomycetes bacterium]